MSSISTGDSVELVCSRDAAYVSEENIPIFTRLVDQVLTRHDHPHDALAILFSDSAEFMKTYEGVVFADKVYAHEGRERARYIEAIRLMRLLNRAVSDTLFNDALYADEDELASRAQKFLKTSDGFANTDCDFTGIAEVEIAAHDEDNYSAVLQCGKCGRFMRLPVRAENAYAQW